jgi:type II restriction enzyme
VEKIESVIAQWKADADSTYNTWFLGDERLKNFRSIREGIKKIIHEIETDSFGTGYKNSSLETILHSVTEQTQVFKGADHAFIWKPKLRIPDIYENRQNQKDFGRFLFSCNDCCKDESHFEDHVRLLSSKKIKGLGPAVVNLLYFIHPTIVLPSNTALLKGYNFVFNGKAKLGSWEEYLQMRRNVVGFSKEYSKYFSNDLGSVGAFFFDMGKLADKGIDLERETIKFENGPLKEKKVNDDLDHTTAQGLLRDIGLALGLQVWIASNDRKKEYAGGRLLEGCLNELPALWEKGDVRETISLIDVLWFDAQGIVAAFEVEHSTSIYSGILRMLDLANTENGASIKGIYLVAPDKREKEVQAQMSRPAFNSIKNLSVRYLKYGDLKSHKDSIMKFGESLKALEKVSTLL